MKSHNDRNVFDELEIVEQHLAPVKGEDIRLTLPKELFIKTPSLFLRKFFFAITLISISWVSFYYFDNVFVKVICFIIAGMIYAHLIELQHECLHHHAFNNRKWNRFFGVISGVFMFSSYSHYKYDHLRHHANLGTDKNTEHFDYRFQNINSFFGFIFAYLDLNRYKKVGSILKLIILGESLPGIESNKFAKHIKQEYVLYFMVFISLMLLSLYFKSYLVLLMWVLPVLIISEGAHFLIELPEHFGLNTQTDPNTLSNTRTIYCNRVVQWYVNGNNLHTAHHYHHGVPMCNVSRLHDLIEEQIVCQDLTYYRFYSQVVNNNIRQSLEQTCMTR